MMTFYGYSIICIGNDLIHKITGLSNEGCNLVNIKNVHKLVETNLNTSFDGRNMNINTIQDNRVRFISKILGYKFNHVSRIDSVRVRFLHATYLMVVKGEKVNLCDIIQTQ